MTFFILDGEYTLFAPTDLAFGRYSHLNDIHRDTPNAGKIYLGKYINICYFIHH
jgi:hypothetical protein